MPHIVNSRPEHRLQFRKWRSEYMALSLSTGLPISESRLMIFWAVWSGAPMPHWAVSVEGVGLAWEAGTLAGGVVGGVEAVEARSPAPPTMASTSLTSLSLSLV